MGRLDELDLSQKLGRKAEAKRLNAAQRRLLQLRLQLGGLAGEEPQIGPALCFLFEGWDASGKGGAIKRLVGGLDPRHVRVAQFAAPTPDEKRHHFLHRFGPALPGWGGMAVLDRSWYGRVLVERVEGYATEEQWQRGYDEINGFERTLANEGMIIVKYWIHVSEETQLRRFQARNDDPLKSWKLTDEDWRNRDQRDAYVEAVDDMLDRTDTDWAPWVLVAGDSKRFARVQVLESAIEHIERGMRTRGFEPTPAAASAS